MEEIKDIGGGPPMSEVVEELSPQTDGNALWGVDVNIIAPSSSPPLQASDGSAASSLSTWNNGDICSASSVEISDESSSSPDVQGQVICEFEIAKAPACVIDAQLQGISEGVSGCTSWMNSAETCQEEDRAAFNRVVGDAPQRAHIRLKSRHHRGKGEASDVSSDSSSYNRDSPPNVLNLSNIGGKKQQDGNVESEEGSSGSGVFFRPTQNAAKHLLKHGKTNKGDKSQSDAGIAACTCGSSTSQQSSMSVSRDSSGTAGDSGFGTARKSSNSCKRSLATHYQNIKHCGENDAETFNSSSSTVHNIRTVPDTEPDTDRDRKRKRFNRTFSALRQCGLLDLTLQTATLMEQSQRMQKQLETLRKETKVLYGAMKQFSHVQPNFLQTNSAQQVMNNLEQIAKGDHENSLVKKLLEESESDKSTTQLLRGALTLQQKIFETKASGKDYSPPSKKLKQKHSGSSSQTLTSTSSPNTDSDELQKQYDEIQKLIKHK